MATSAVDGVAVITGVGRYWLSKRTIQLSIPPSRLLEELVGKPRFPSLRPEQLPSSSRILTRLRLSKRPKKANNSHLIPNTASLLSMSM